MFILPPLPYRYDALEPAVSTKTLRFHHDKHHQGYVDKTNKLVREQGLTGLSMEAVVKKAKGPLFNNAAQAWNHAFFWESMTPNYEKPSKRLAALREAFIEEGADHFASGWVWIVQSGDELKVTSTHDADTALKHRGKPVIVCDLWEHAYYLDYQNDRKGFLEAWFDKVANWRFAENQLRAFEGEGTAYAYPLPEDMSGQRKSA